MVRLDFFGYRYSDTNPSLLNAGANFYWHRPSKRLLDKAAVDAAMTAAKYTVPTQEIGNPTAAYVSDHFGLPVTAAVPPPKAPGAGGGGPPTPAGKAITASVTKVPTANADDTGQITFAGGPADKAYMVTVTTKDAGSAGDDVQNVNVTKGDTATQVATAVAAAISDPAVTATSAGPVVTVTPGKGSTLDKLTVAVA